MLAAVLTTLPSKRVQTGPEADVLKQWLLISGHQPWEQKGQPQALV